MKTLLSTEYITFMHVKQGMSVVFNKAGNESISPLTFGVVSRLGF